jgi:hypothetical protein
VLAPAAALVAACWGRPTLAFEKRVCAASYETAQLLRHQQKLRKAREHLAICAHSSCPSVVTNDCATWLKEVDGTIPTLLFRVRDERGHAVSDFRVLVDGEPLPRDLDAPLPFDPGPHVVRIEAEGFAPLEQNVILRAKEQGRVHESLLFSARREPAATELPAASPRILPQKSEASPLAAPLADRKQESSPLADPPRAESSSARETGMYLAGGIGLLALGGAAYLGLQGTKEANHMRATCAPDCAKADVDAARTKLVAANVSLGVGIGAVAVAGILWLTGSSASPQSSGRPRLVGLAVVPAPSGGGGEMVTTFSGP